MQSHKYYSKSKRFVYFVEAVGTDAIKIGCALQNPQGANDIKHATRRLIDLQAWCPFKLRLLATTRKYTEEMLHEKFKPIRIRSEWFKATKELKQFIKTVESHAVCSKCGNYIGKGNKQWLK